MHCRVQHLIGGVLHPAGLRPVQRHGATHKGRRSHAPDSTVVTIARRNFADEFFAVECIELVFNGDQVALDLADQVEGCKR
jgi:hypothetical protein